ncbi:MAG: hypothetical protein ACOH2V_00265 [Candidatus Saccharimonadaceae bacterium]
MLSGWTQSSKNWTIIPDSEQVENPYIEFRYRNKDISNLRIYVTTLEKYRELYDINEGIIFSQSKQLNTYKSIVINDSIAINAGREALNQSKLINDKLIKQVTKYQRRTNRWPYWIGSGFLGGVILCLLVK